MKCWRGRRAQWSKMAQIEKGTEPKLPADLRKVLAASARAKAQWEVLTPIARRDFVTWIESAKRLETRKRRIEVATANPLRVDSVRKRGRLGGRHLRCVLTVHPAPLTLEQGARMDDGPLPAQGTFLSRWPRASELFHDMCNHGHRHISLRQFRRCTPTNNLHGEFFRHIGDVRWRQRCCGCRSI